MHSIRVTKYNQKNSEATAKLEVIKTLIDADKYYWRLCAASEELEVRKQDYELSKQLLTRAKNLVQAGQRSQIDVIRAEVGVSQ